MRGLEIRLYTRKNAQVDAILMKTGLNNVLLPTLFTVIIIIIMMVYYYVKWHQLVNYFTFTSRKSKIYIPGVPKKSTPV